MTTLQAIWLFIGLVLLGFILIAWLKGAFSLVRNVGRRFSREAGTPWTLGAFAEPFGAIVVVFFVAAVGIAHPDSLWARWFYGPKRMAKARGQHADE
jgi:hypothetical protein